jgi:MFS family permease
MRFWIPGALPRYANSMASEPGANTAPSTEAQPPRGRSTFSSLKYRDFRFLWFAQIGRSAALWMEQIARPVLILELTDSELLLGLVVAARMTPQLLFGLISGVLADRFDRKRILMAAQVATMSFHLITAALVLSGVVEAWHVFALAFATGTSMVFNQTARQSLIPQVVPPEQVQNAVALNMAALNVMRVAGPTLAGVILVGGTVGPVYLISGILGAASIILIALVRIKPEPREEKPDASWLGDLREGIAYAVERPKVLAVLAAPLIMFVFGIPYISVFLPLFAKDPEVLNLGNSGVGALMAVTGAGAIIGTLVLASQTQLRRRGMLILLLMALFSVFLILFSRSTVLAISIVTLMAAASMSSSFMAITNSLILELSPSEMRGRVLSLMSIDRGLVPLGAMLAGALAESIGPRDGLLVMAGLCLGLTLLAAAFVPPFRRI